MVMPTLRIGELAELGLSLDEISDALVEQDDEDLRELLGERDRDLVARAERIESQRASIAELLARADDLRRPESVGEVMARAATPSTILYEILVELYNSDVTSISVSEARENLAQIIEAARSGAVILERYGQPAAVVVSPERYEQLLGALEEAEDLAAFDAALTEEGPNIPWEQVRADLGWT